MRSFLKNASVLVFALATQLGHAMNIYTSQNDGEDYSYIIANDAMLSSTDATKIRRFLTQQATRGIPSAIYITSPGGFAELMSTFAKAIIEPSNQLFAKNGLRNIVVINEECSSACVILMGHLTNARDERALKILVHPEAKFGFHSPVTVNNGAVTAIADEKEQEKRIKIQIDSLHESGVNPEWLAANEALFRSSEMKFLSGQNLCKASVGIVPSEACDAGAKDLSELVRAELSAVTPKVRRVVTKPKPKQGVPLNINPLPGSPAR